jgi:hypothetical protein
MRTEVSKLNLARSRSQIYLSVPLKCLTAFACSDSRKKLELLPEGFRGAEVGLGTGEAVYSPILRLQEAFFLIPKLSMMLYFVPLENEQ